MRSYTFTLSTVQQLGFPEQLNNYLFVDPVYGLGFVFPLTADGGLYTNGGADYTQIEDGELYFPWGYLITTSITSITADTFKGPYEITFSPANVDTSYYAILKILYDFGDGETRDVEHGIVTGATTNEGIQDPAQVNVTHTYWPSAGLTTFTPTITVLNGNLGVNIIRYNLSFVPSSVYDFKDFHLLNTAQHTYAGEETFGVFEIDNSRHLTNARFFSGGTTQYNLSADSLYSIFYTTPGLLLNLDASDTFSVVFDSLNKVSKWKDKSGLGNDFIQTNNAHKPSLIFPLQTEAARKAIKFISNTTSEYLQCVNNSLFNSITGQYTAFFIVHTADVNGTIFYGGSAHNGANCAFSFGNTNASNVVQGISGVSFQNLSLVLPTYSLYAIRAYDNTVLQFTADELTITQNRLNLSYGSSLTNATISMAASAHINGFDLVPATNSEVSQILLYNRALSDDEMANISQTLYSKWGITPQND